MWGLLCPGFVDDFRSFEARSDQGSGDEKRSKHAEAMPMNDRQESRACFRSPAFSFPGLCRAREGQPRPGGIQLTAPWDSMHTHAATLQRSVGERP